VKTPEWKFGNDQIFDMQNFDEMSRRIRWSENEFSHSLTRGLAGREASFALAKVQTRPSDKHRMEDDADIYNDGFWH
jgi:hypothetical protein